MFFPDDQSRIPGPDPMDALAQQAQKALREVYTPAGLLQQVKNVVLLCWMIQPDKNRTPEHVGQLMHAALEDALTALKTDPRAFGVSEIPSFKDPDEVI
jgi:hypothetical protein